MSDVVRVSGAHIEHLNDAPQLADISFREVDGIPFVNVNFLDIGLHVSAPSLKLEMDEKEYAIRYLHGANSFALWEVRFNKESKCYDEVKKAVLRHNEKFRKQQEVILSMPGPVVPGEIQHTD